MKLKFKTQAYQTAAVQAVIDCCKGQPPASVQASSYRIDPGKARKGVEVCGHPAKPPRVIVFPMRISQVAVLNPLSETAAVVSWDRC
jgi:hypothetical protein